MATTSTKTPTLRLTAKPSYDQQALFPFPYSSLPRLPASHVRIQPILLGLMSTNLSYCAMGDILHWYAAYPVRKTVPGGVVPEEYRDERRWGVPVGWGYAVVRESDVAGLEVGKRVFGMLPMCDVPVDLKLVEEPGGKGRQWLEVSGHREKMMGIYKRYVVVEEDFEEGVTEGWREWRSGVGTVWQCGYLLNRYCFQGRENGPVLSVAPGTVEWSAEDADLSRSVVFTLGSGSKTCRSFVQQLACNRDATRGPVALAEVTESGSSVADLKLHFEHRVVGYKAAAGTDAMQWLDALDAQVSRVVVIDFGGRGTTANDLLTVLRGSNSSKRVDLVAVGSEPKVSTKEDIMAGAAWKAEQKAIQVNTSPIIEALMRELGAYNGQEELVNEWRKVVDSELARNDGTERAGLVLGLKLDVRNGVGGDDGLEGAWRELCEGRVKSNSACVIAL